MRESSPFTGALVPAGGGEVEAALSGTLRIVILDDAPDDAELAERELRKAGLRFVSRRCDSKESLERSLVDFRPDVVISDFGMPNFSGLDALQVVRAKHPELPFILVSGTIGEERAIDILKSGATDYVLKDRLARLASAVQRALREVEETAERRRAEDALRTSEEQLRQAQKMEAIGSLAGGVAHDFNNLLTVIRGYSDLGMMKLGSQEPLRRELEEITKAAERASALTRQLLAFSRKQVLAPRVLSINGVVAGIEKMVRRLIGEDIEFMTVLHDGTGRVRADAGQIEQVIMNLVVNARDAMPQGGRLTIETKGVVLDEALARQHGAVLAGRYVVLIVSDSGHGIDPEARPHIFEPFFTTKDVGRGTGLGLSTVYGIVTQSGGHIEVYSESGRGTAFAIYLPEVKEEIEPTELVPKALGSPKGTATILLVEDDDLVRGVTHAILVMNGYTVLSASSGAEAVLVCKQHEGPIDLVMTDVVMPGMDGRQTAEHLTRLRPAVKVLYSSGYADDTIVRHGVLEPGTEFIQKPFTAEALARKIVEILHAGHRTSRHV